ncbi:MAG: hypothetical protein U5N85_17585 [Arcicella sp.]|nr:hypothetical protein [Arcicella sp.]
MTIRKNTMTIGIILILIGVCAIVSGIVFIRKDTVSSVTKTASFKADELIKEVPEAKTDKQKGDDFEKYVVQKFSKSYFSILEWASDKYVNGIYAKSNTHPDLTLKFKFKDIDTDFAVECKYRSDYYKNGIEWCSARQLSNYQAFAQEKGTKVFVVIGVGGEATAPEELYIVPLTEVKGIFLDKAFLGKYKKDNFKDKNLFYDYEIGVLR